MRSVSASESTVSISLSEESDSLAVARPLASEGVAVEDDSVTEICGMEGFSVVEFEDMTDEAFVPRERPLEAVSGIRSMSGAEVTGGCGVLSETGESVSGGRVSMSVMVV